MHPSELRFVGGLDGIWAVEGIRAVVGDGLSTCDRVALVPATEPLSAGAWTLRGVPGHERYTQAAEHDALKAVQPPLGRPEASCAALIPIRKSAAWWQLSQDQRRSILEEQSHHIRYGMGFLPAVARRLYHSRDLGESFDFLTWFEFAPADKPAFDELVAGLRATPEWTHVEREVEVRLVRRG
ncbi:MAG: chlorite dismutase family protein [Deltaproteobacteria bacterium]|nr:chlorite dismutase family protein [Nannocystaceae bacterium]